MEHTWIATSAFGLEGIVRDELKRLKMRHVTVEHGGVKFLATYAEAYKALLWLRCADRVRLLLGEGRVTSFEDLYQLVHSIPFETILPYDGAYHISGQCARSQLMSVRDCQAITKKSLIERLKKVYQLDFFPENKEIYAVDVSIHSDFARITLDATGSALNKRGYRVFNGEAALRETMAAALVLISPWDQETMLYDPCCGTGTILIEAAMIASQTAPGKSRYFSIDEWRYIDKNAFVRERSLANIIGKIPDGCVIAGSDINPEALSFSHQHIKRAGYAGSIQCSLKNLKDFTHKEKRGLFIMNPPYGVRMSDKKTSEQLGLEIGKMMKRHNGYTFCILSDNPGMERLVGEKASSKRRFYNGRIECEFFIFN